MVVPREHHCNKEQLELQKSQCAQHHASWLRAVAAGKDGWSPVPSLTQHEPAGAAGLSAGTHGQIPQPQLAQHSWEERGRQPASLATPQPCHGAGPGGKAVLGGGGTGMDLHMRDLLFRWQLGSWACG